MFKRVSSIALELRLNFKGETKTAITANENVFLITSPLNHVLIHHRLTLDAPFGLRVSAMRTLVLHTPKIVVST